MYFQIFIFMPLDIPTNNKCFIFSRMYKNHKLKTKTSLIVIIVAVIIIAVLAVAVYAKSDLSKVDTIT